MKLFGKIQLMNLLKAVVLVIVFFNASSLFAQGPYSVTQTTDFDPFLWSTYNDVPSNPNYSNIHGTLQWAIRKANADLSGGAILINFNITSVPLQNVATINLQYILPPIIKQVTIDGTTSGYTGADPKITISGMNLPTTGAPNGLL